VSDLLRILLPAGLLGRFPDYLLEMPKPNVDPDSKWTLAPKTGPARFARARLRVSGLKRPLLAHVTPEIAAKGTVDPYDLCGATAMSRPSRRRWCIQVFRVKSMAGYTNAFQPRGYGRACILTSVYAPFRHSLRAGWGSLCAPCAFPPQLRDSPKVPQKLRKAPLGFKGAGPG
jgi:hypothetical protein